MTDPHPGTKLPRPHRCNARLEDFLQSLYTLEFSAKISPTWANFRACLASEVGEEPTVPYLVVKDPEAYLDPARLYRPRGEKPL